MPRLPGVYNRDELPEDKRNVFDYIVETRGSMSHSFGSLMHSPDAAARIAQLGTFIRFESSLDRRVKELAALTASSELENAYERSIHARTCAELGVPDELIEAIVERHPLKSDVPVEDEVPVNLAREMTVTHFVSEDTFASVLARYGETMTVDLIATIAYYSMLAYVHNALDIQPPQQ